MQILRPGTWPSLLPWPTGLITRYRATISVADAAGPIEACISLLQFRSNLPSFSPERSRGDATGQVQKSALAATHTLSDSIANGINYYCSVVASELVGGLCAAFTIFLWMRLSISSSVRPSSRRISILCWPVTGAGRRLNDLL